MIEIIIFLFCIVFIIVFMKGLEFLHKEIKKKRNKQQFDLWLAKEKRKYTEPFKKNEELECLWQELQKKGYGLNELIDMCEIEYFKFRAKSLLMEYYLLQDGIFYQLSIGQLYAIFKFFPEYREKIWSILIVRRDRLNGERYKDYYGNEPDILFLDIVSVDQSFRKRVIQLIGNASYPGHIFKDVVRLVPDWQEEIWSIIEKRIIVIHYGTRSKYSSIPHPDKRFVKLDDLVKIIKTSALLRERAIKKILDSEFIDHLSYELEEISRIAPEFQYLIDQFKFKTRPPSEVINDMKQKAK